MWLAYSKFFGLNNASLAGPGFSVRLMQADPDRLVVRHSHEGAHVVAVLSGKYLSLASPDAPLHATAIVCNPHGVEHADTFDGGAGRFLALSFEPDRYPRGPADTPVPHVLNSLPALTAVLRIWSQLKLADRHDPQLLEASVLQIAACGAPPVSAKGAHAPPRWAREAYDRMTSGDASASIAELAHAQGMHPVAFSRAFRRYFGRSPLALAIETRLRRAAQDLARSSTPIAEVGLKWGFFDQAHFSRRFQSRFGASPGLFRRAFQS